MTLYYSTAANRSTPGRLIPYCAVKNSCPKGRDESRRSRASPTGCKTVLGRPERSTHGKTASIRFNRSCNTPKSGLRSNRRQPQGKPSSSKPRNVSNSLCNWRGILAPPPPEGIGKPSNKRDPIFQESLVWAGGEEVPSGKIRLRPKPLYPILLPCRQTNHPLFES